MSYRDERAQRRAAYRTELAAPVAVIHRTYRPRDAKGPVRGVRRTEPLVDDWRTRRCRDCLSPRLRFTSDGWATCLDCGARTTERRTVLPTTYHQRRTQRKAA